MGIYESFTATAPARRRRVITDRDADGIRYAAPFRWRPLVAGFTRRGALTPPGLGEAAK